MAKIDTTQIKDFEKLTADELRKVITDFEYEDNADELAKLQADYDKAKTALNKASSDTASYKKALREKETAEETAKREREEADKKKQEELDTLKKQIDVQNFEKQYLALGYKPELAKATAEAQAEGDWETVNKNQATFVNDLKADIDSKYVNGQPKAQGGDPKGEPLTKESIMAIKDPTKRQTAIAENIELFE